MKTDKDVVIYASERDAEVSCADTHEEKGYVSGDHKLTTYRKKIETNFGRSLGQLLLSMSYTKIFICFYL